MDFILSKINENIAQISINRPESLNALNAQVISELSQTLKDLDHNASVRVIILTGTGEKSFVAGADIKEFSNYQAKEASDMARRGQDNLFNLIENSATPVIAAINGFALGGGLELAMSCHIRYASENARLGLPEVSLGLIPGYGGTQRLARLVGRGMANEMILSAQMISAVRAHEIGLINGVTKQNELLSTVQKLAHDIAQNSPVAIAESIRLINMNEGKEGFEEEIAAFGKLFDNEDKKEGIAAFLEKRKPNFGR